VTGYIKNETYSHNPPHNEEVIIGDMIKARVIDEIHVSNDGSTDKKIDLAQNASSIVIDNIANRHLDKTVQRCDDALMRDADIVVV